MYNMRGATLLLTPVESLVLQMFAPGSKTASSSPPARLRPTLG